MKHQKDRILQLHREGKSRSEIQSLLSCSKSTISFHLSEGQKEKSNKRRTKNRSLNHPYQRKLENFKFKQRRQLKTKTQIANWIKILTLKINRFHRDRKLKIMNEPTFTIQDVIQKFGENPTCYLTGVPLDIYKPRDYAFDHMIPISRGGESTIENLNLCTKQVNMAKSDLTPDEFIALCRSVVKTADA